MKYFALNVECSRETFENVAKDIARYMFDHDYRPYRIRDSMFNCMPVYVDGHMTFFCQASKTDRYTAITLEQMDEIVQIFDSHRAEYAVQEDANTMIAWSGTRSKRGYLHWYRVTDEGFLSGDYTKQSVPEGLRDADAFLLNKARIVTMSVLDAYIPATHDAAELFHVTSVECLRSAEINLKEYKLYGMDENTAQTLCIRRFGETASLDYDKGCVYASLDGGTELSDEDCELSDEGCALDEAVASYLGVDRDRVYTFTNDTDQAFPDMIMVMVYPEDVTVSHNYTDEDEECDDDVEEDEE